MLSYAEAEVVLRRLEDDLLERASTIDTFNDYYRGDHPMPKAPRKVRDAFINYVKKCKSNYLALGVDVVEERLNVVGFRFGENTAADRDADDIWQYNHLDANSHLVHIDALVTGYSYVLVTPADPMPIVTIESPFEVIVEQSSGTRERVYGLKRWYEKTDGRVYATLYTADHVYKFQSNARANNVNRENSMPREKTGKWEPRDGVEFAVSHDLGVVPIVPFRNRPDVFGTGYSEIEGTIDIQDRINKLTFDMMVAAEYGAFRQRWATGLEGQVDENGEIGPGFNAAADRLWASENPEVTFGEFSQTDLKQFTETIQNQVEQIANQMRLPQHYFGGQWPSGDALRSAEAKLVRLAKRKHRWFGESWEEVMRLAFAAMGDEERASVVTAETIWEDPETRTEGEQVDAAVKKATIGVPWQQLWEDLDYTPNQIQRFPAMQTQTMLLSALYAQASAEPEPVEEPAPDEVEDA